MPPQVRQDIVLDDSDLRRELARLTDWHVDALFSFVLELGGSLFLNRLSRLVFDPERFVDDEAEPMAAVGQGIVYTKTTEGSVLATISAKERESRIRRFYVPYHEGLTALVAATVERFGMAIILDCHSFASIPLPSEPDQSLDRPDICIGSDAFHTPAALAQRLLQAFGAEGLRVQLDHPFAGTLVPLQFLGLDSRVQSVMIEVRRGLYCDESTGERSLNFEAARAVVERAVTAAVASALRAG